MTDFSLPGEELLMAGRYAEAWPLFDQRRPRLDALPKMAGWPEWRGEELRGKAILLWGEQGIGDEVMFARFVPRLRALGATHITVLCRAENLRLFRQLGADVVIDRAVPTAQVPPFDYWAMTASLPRWMGVEFATVPGEPYLVGAGRDGGIGVAWRGNPENPRDKLRSLPSGDLLLGLPGARELTAQGDTVDSLAHLAGLDLVITVDTAWAHLAGALGKPVWILLPQRGLDWRWRPEGETTPWYPTARLFRQQEDGDWAGALRGVGAALRLHQFAPR